MDVRRNDYKQHQAGGMLCFQCEPVLPALSKRCLLEDRNVPYPPRFTDDFACRAGRRSRSNFHSLSKRAHTCASNGSGRCAIAGGVDGQSAGSAANFASAVVAWPFPAKENGCARLVERIQLALCSIRLQDILICNQSKLLLIACVGKMVMGYEADSIVNARSTSMSMK